MKAGGMYIFSWVLKEYFPTKKMGSEVEMWFPDFFLYFNSNLPNNNNKLIESYICSFSVFPALFRFCFCFETTSPNNV